MKRRGVTVLVGAILVAALTALVGQAKVPYVQLEPGPTYDTLGEDDDGKDVIVLTGASASDSAGQLRFVTVGVQRNLTLLQAIVGWWRDDDAVVPEEVVYPPDQKPEDVDRRNAEEFADSRSAAQAAALAELGYGVKIAVKEVAPDTPAAGKLRPGDVITRIDGTTVDSAEKMLELIRGRPAGTELTFEVDRAGTAVTVRMPTVAGDDGVPRVGFSPEVRSAAPFTLEIPIEGIGGPSAGLMLALGIIDKIKPEDLTGGKIIAGTGTIDAAGNVGPIGGVPQKLVSAKEAGATFFLTPSSNCAEAVANAKPGLVLIEVAKLDDALAALAEIRAGGQPRRCPGAP
jgi:PDZ domain-containing protein